MTSTPNQPLTTDNTKPAVPIHNLQSVPLAAISAQPKQPTKAFRSDRTERTRRLHQGSWSTPARSASPQWWTR